MANYLVIKNNSATKSYLLKSTHSSTPFIKVSDKYLDLASTTTSGIQIKLSINNVLYRPKQIYNTTTTKQSIYTSTSGYSGISSKSSQYTSTSGYSGISSKSSQYTSTSGYSGISSKSSQYTSTSGYSGVSTRSSQYTSTSGYNGSLTKSSQYTSTSGYSGIRKSTITTYTKTQLNGTSLLTSVTSSKVSYIASFIKYSQNWSGFGSMNATTSSRQINLTYSSLITNTIISYSNSIGRYNEQFSLQNVGAQTLTAAPTYKGTKTGTLSKSGLVAWGATFPFAIYSTNTNTSNSNYAYQRWYSHIFSANDTGVMSHGHTKPSLMANAYAHVTISGDQTVVYSTNSLYSGRYSGTQTIKTSATISATSWSSITVLTKTASRTSTYSTSSTAQGNLSSTTALTKTASKQSNYNISSTTTNAGISSTTALTKTTSRQSNYSTSSTAITNLSSTTALTKSSTKQSNYSTSSTIATNLSSTTALTKTTSRQSNYSTSSTVITNLSSTTALTKQTTRSSQYNTSIEQ